MESPRFDTLTRTLAVARSRREVGAVAAALLAGALSRAPVAEAVTPRQAATNLAATQKRKCKRPKRTCGKQCVNLKTSAKYCGGCNQPCAAGDLCQNGVCGPAACDGPCLVFTTSTDHDANLGGLAGADAICATHAANAAPSPLPGTYKAWLSDGNASPASRFTRSPAPYQLVDGTVIANDWADLTSGGLRHQINRDENNQPAFWYTWTGTKPNGTSAPRAATCQGWTSASGDIQGWVGSPSDNAVGWTADPVTRVGCFGEAYLYCFQQTP